MHVESILKRDVTACSANDTLNRAAQFMWEKACGCLTVVDDPGKPIGFIQTEISVWLPRLRPPASDASRQHVDCAQRNQLPH